MTFSDAAFDLAEIISDQERQTGIKAASSAVSGAGLHLCQDCCSPISEARRKAASFARRCIDCQTEYERERLAR